MYLSKNILYEKNPQDSVVVISNFICVNAFMGPHDSVVKLSILFLRIFLETNGFFSFEIDNLTFKLVLVTA